MSRHCCLNESPENSCGVATTKLALRGWGERSFAAWRRQGRSFFTSSGLRGGPVALAAVGYRSTRSHRDERSPQPSQRELRSSRLASSSGDSFNNSVGPSTNVTLLADNRGMSLFVLIKTAISFRNARVEFLSASLQARAGSNERVAGSSLGSSGHEPITLPLSAIPPPTAQTHSVGLRRAVEPSRRAPWRRHLVRNSTGPPFSGRALRSIAAP